MREKSVKEKMNWIKVRTCSAAVLVLLGVLTAAGCSKKEEVSGNLQLAGSTSMEDMCIALGEAFMEKEPKVTVSAEYIGSTAGMEALLNGSTAIGTSSRNLTAEELAQGAVENVVAKDGIAVILNHSVEGVRDLSTEELQQIFCGEITNWSELGGPDLPVVVIGHEAGSGTRDPFEEILGIVDQCQYSNELSGSGAVLVKTAATDGSVGYISMALADDTIQAVSVDGIAPTRENVQNGTYFLNKTMVMATMGKIEEQEPLVQAFFDFVYSEEGQKLIDGVNLTPIPARS